MEGHRYLPNGTLLAWQQIGVKDLLTDPQLPFFVRWESDPSVHPSVGGSDVELTKIELAGDHDTVDDWLGGQADVILDQVGIDWVSPEGQPGLVAATFSTPRGEVRI